ncbi:MAG TPA: BrnA antitoxin family protein [Longimicrobium sp.]|nr:BrnA antitoxin family protein [Longimicrobium sp.]
MKDEYDFSNGVRGPVFPPPPGTTRVTLRLDNEVLDWFREQVHAACGGDYTRLINAALRDHISRGETLEQMMRRVVREELHRFGTVP